MIGSNGVFGLIYPLLSVLSGVIRDAKQAGELAWSINSLAEKSLLLAGSGLVLGLGIGITVSGATVYLVKRKQIRNKLQV